MNIEAEENSWMKVDDFIDSPKLMPEFKKNEFLKLLKGKHLFYKGLYKESDGSFDVIEMRNV